MAGEPTTSIEPIQVDRVDDSEKSLSEISGYSQEKRNGMYKEIKQLIHYLTTSHDVFEVEKAYKMLQQYISKYDRIMYSTVSIEVYGITSKDDENQNSDTFGTMLTNAEILLDYAENRKDKFVRKKDEDVDKTVRAAWKIYDHINLANKQYAQLRQSDSEYRERFKEQIEPIKKDITKEMNGQLLSMVGIFTALAFILFGGISSLSDVFSGLKDSHILRMLIAGCVWGIALTNVVFVFLYFVGKMTGLQIESSQAENAGFRKKYPVVCWANFVLVSLLLIFLWVYYCVNRNGSSLLDEVIRSDPVGASIWGIVDYSGS